MAPEQFSVRFLDGGQRKNRVDNDAKPKRCKVKTSIEFEYERTRFKIITIAVVPTLLPGGAGPIDLQSEK